MNCTDCRPLLADRLDDLLEEDVAARVDAHVTECVPCAEARETAEHTRALLYRAYKVETPTADLPQRVRAAAAGSRPGRAAMLRYAASFAAGVLVTLAISSRGAEPEPEIRVPPEPQATAGPIEPDADATPLLRIR